MPTEKPLERFLYRYRHPASHSLYSFAVGVPQLMLQELKSGQTNPNPGKIILERLSDREKKQLKEMLGTDVSSDRFQVLPVAPHPDTLFGLPTFNGDEGKKFWIFPKETVKF